MSSLFPHIRGEDNGFGDLFHCFSHIHTLFVYLFIGLIFGERHLFHEYALGPFNDLSRLEGLLRGEDLVAQVCIFNGHGGLVRDGLQDIDLFFLVYMFALCVAVDDADNPVFDQHGNREE